MLKRESLLGLRTSQDVKSSLDVARRGAPTLHQRQGLEEAVTPRVPAGLLSRLLAADQARLNRQEESIRRSQEKLLEMRRKLKARKCVNEQLSLLRREVMAARKRGAQVSAPGPSPEPSPEPDPRAAARRQRESDQILQLRY